MIKNAFAYVTRKSLKSIIILLVIMAMSTLSLISLAIKDATNRASEETFKNITNSFSMEINRRVNLGTPRGGGNIKGKDIKKIAESEDISSFVKRINSVADLVDNDIIETKKTIANQSPERAENFKRTVMLTGVNDSSKENKFVSGGYKLIEGEHLEENDKSKILIHKDLAEKNNLKIGDKIKIKSNLFDADNEKGANETLEVEIKGIFDGHNKSSVTSAQELYENTLITDLDTAAKVYGNTEDTAVYQDATFFVKGDKNLDQVIKNIKKLVLGDWYMEGYSRLEYAIYDDGSCQVRSGYGLGKWSIVNDDKLRISDFYGQTLIYKIEKISKKSMTLRLIWDGKESETADTFYHTAEEAEKH